MPPPVVLDRPLTPGDVAAVAAGADLVLSAAAADRIREGAAIVDAFVATGRRGYGINTGVGAFADIVIAPEEMAALSHAIVESHAAGFGPSLRTAETRAIMAAMVNNVAHGTTGARLEVADAICALLRANSTPVVPSRGSVGYLTHAAAVALVLVGDGLATRAGTVLGGAAAMRAAGLAPLRLRAKEGLVLVGGTCCATGLSALAVERARRLLALATLAAAVTVEALGGEIAAYAPEVLALHRSPGAATVGRELLAHLGGSALRAARARGRTQDAISLRAVPQIHGAALDVLAGVAVVVERELGSATDNPAVSGTPDAPEVRSHAHGLATGLALAMDSLAASLALVGTASERRTARLLDPAVSGLPAFLAVRPGLHSGLQILQYTAAALVAEARRLAVPVALGGGTTAGGQEDVLAHATPAALNALEAVETLERIVAIEFLAGLQAEALERSDLARGAGTAAVLAAARRRIPPYADDRPIGADIETMRALMFTFEADAPAVAPALAGIPLPQSVVEAVTGSPPPTGGGQVAETANERP